MKISIFRNLLCACGVMASAGAIAAYVIPRPGMSPIGISPPMNPVNGAQCTAFAKESADYQSRLGEWHQQCLDSNKRCSRGSKGECSCAACEGLHVARDRFTRESLAEGKECFDAVSRNRQAIRDSAGTPEQASALQTALLAGTSSVAISQLRRTVAELLSNELLTAGDLTKASRIAESSARLWRGVEGAREDCLKRVGIQSGSACEQQLLLSTRGFSGIVTANNSVFVRAIQNNMLALIDQQNRRSLDLLNRTFRDAARDTAEEQPGQSFGR